jgi:hypothetical protein
VGVLEGQIDRLTENVNLLISYPGVRLLVFILVFCNFNSEFIWLFHYMLLTRDVYFHVL